MKKLSQKIKGNNNIQVAGDYIKTEKINPPKINVIHNPEQHINSEQALKIRDKIDEIVSMLASDGSSKATHYKKEYRALYNAFGIHKYDVLPKDRFDEAMKWFQKRIAFHGRKTLRKTDTSEWRKQLYTAINARARELGMNKEDIYVFAEKSLDLKKPLLSLKDLSDTRLKKLYTKIFSKV